VSAAANDLPVGGYYDLTAKTMDRLSVSSNKKRGLDGRYGRCLALCFADYLLDPCVVLCNVDACLLFHVAYGIIDEGVVSSRVEAT
jgi:hypothetical protein